MYVYVCYPGIVGYYVRTVSDASHRLVQVWANDDVPLRAKQGKGSEIQERAKKRRYIYIHTRALTHTYIHVHIYIYTYIHIGLSKELRAYLPQTFVRLLDRSRVGIAEFWEAATEEESRYADAFGIHHEQLVHYLVQIKIYLHVCMSRLKGIYQQKAANKIALIESITVAEMMQDTRSTMDEWKLAMVAGTFT